MKQKGIASIVLLIALIIGGYVIYTTYSNNRYKPDFKLQATQVTPTPSFQSESSSSAETANWKTYTNPKYGYSVKYPLNWSLVEAESAKPEKITFSSPTENILLDKPALVTFTP